MTWVLLLFPSRDLGAVRKKKTRSRKRKSRGSAYVYPKISLATTRGKERFLPPVVPRKIVICKKCTFRLPFAWRAFRPPLCTFILSRRNRAVKRYFIKKPIPRPLKCATPPIKVDKRVFFLYTIPVNYSGETKKRRRRCNPHAVRLSLRQRGQSGFISLGRFRAAFFFGIRRTNVIR